MNSNKVTDAITVLLNGKKLSHVVSVTSLHGFGEAVVAKLNDKGNIYSDGEGKLVTETLTGEIWTGA